MSPDGRVFNRHCLLMVTMISFGYLRSSSDLIRGTLSLARWEIPLRISGS